MPLNQTLRKNSNVLWTISLIQDQTPEAQTKSEFSEMTNDVLSTVTISRLTLCLADNLQRFRFMIRDGISEEEAIKECQKMSTQWHKDNSVSLEKLKDSKNLSLLTWEEFIEWPQYSETITKLENWYKENREFRNDVDGRIRQASENIKLDAKISNPIQQTELLKKYLFEECAFQKFAASKGFEYEIYKTTMSKAMRRVKNNTDYVPRGYMVETHFTQFNKKNLITNSYPVLSEKESFKPVLGKLSPSYSANVEISRSSKFAEFIEKTLQMLPAKEQERAVDALMRFTTQEILPLCYSNNPEILKI